MKIPKILSFFIVVSLVLPGCSLFEKPDLGLVPENALSADHVTVFAIDHTDEDQMKKLKNLIQKFPLEDIKKMNDEDPGKKEELILDIIQKKWKVVAEMDFGTFGANTNGIVVAGQFEQMEKVEELIEVFAEEIGAEKDEQDDVKYWSAPSKMVYLAQYDDIFVFAILEEELDRAIDNLKNGTGMEELSEGGLGYAVFNVDAFADYMGDYEMEGEIVTKMYVDDDGIKFESEVSVSDTEYFEHVGGDEALSAVKIVESVPADGIMIYAEEPNFGSLIQGLINGINSGNLQPGTIMSYEEAVESFAVVTGLTTEEVDKLAYLPFAIAVHDKGELYPAISLYLKMSKGIEAIGKKLTMAIDQYLELLIYEFDLAVGENGAGALKKDIKVVQGGGVNRLYLDWSALPQEVIDGYNVIPGFDVSTVNFELYYGVTGSDVLVLALYPGFDQEFGKDSLADDKVFKAAVERIGGKYDVNVSYFDVAPMVNMVDKYVDMLKQSGVMTTEHLDIYEIVRDFVNTVDYVVGASWLDGEILKSGEYIMLGEE